MSSLCQEGVVAAPMGHGHRVGLVHHGSRDSLTAAPREDRAESGAADGGLPTGPLVLVGGQEILARQTLRRLLESANYRVWEADTGRATLTMMSDDVSVVLIDLAMPEVSGRDCLGHLQQRFPDAPVIFISRMGDVPDVVPAIREGAFDCFTRSCHPEHLLARVRDAARLARLARENRALGQLARCPAGEATLSGKSALMQALRQQIETFARLDSSVLVTGPPGSGKTTAARWLHAHGPRAMGPLVLVHCGATPRDLIEVELFGRKGEAEAGWRSDRPGRAEMAAGGTLLLDEVGEAPPEVQSRLLELLRDRAARRVGSDEPMPLDVRLIATTSCDLSHLCRQGCFREDLLLRLGVLSLHMPPLRDRAENVPDIAAVLLARIARRRGGPEVELAPEAIDSLQQYDWPGGIGELESVLEHAYSLCGGSTITRKNLTRLSATPAASAGSAGSLGLAGFTLAEIERCAVIETMRACGGNKAQTARRLGVSEKTIYNKIKQYSLHGTN